ncbi:MAG: Asp-tRNA(Asn)/Glu-tRNA(Gln) amidotransferase subunit GatA, partial [Oscillospiraceae bacterium]|nr:Asp-tRNA(Asn)/Glu-tRNA(Gln) amidotransferase subunit GatA [Oscillospiraceae bacterium]
MAGIREVQKRLQNKEISCLELTKLYLAAAKRENPRLCAYISFTEETALDAAKRVDGKIKAGETLAPLAGVPFVL